jgi:hypothetical protein
VISKSMREIEFKTHDFESSGWNWVGWTGIEIKYLDFELVQALESKSNTLNLESKLEIKINLPGFEIKFLGLVKINHLEIKIKYLEIKIDHLGIKIKYLEILWHLIPTF